MIPIKNITPTKIGNSYYDLIPKQYITNGLLSVNKKYNLSIGDFELKQQLIIKIDKSYYFLIPVKKINEGLIDLNKEHCVNIVEDI